MVKLALSALAATMLLAFPGSDALAASKTKAAAVKKVKKAQDDDERVVRRLVTVNGKRKYITQKVSTLSTMGDKAGLAQTHDPLDLKSNVAFVLDQENAEVLFEKNANVALPIASITKLMTGLIVVEAKQDMDEVLTVTDDDVDREKHSSSRLKVGSKLTRADMLHIALMSSENRAASALGRNYPGGLPAFVEAMNAKARELGMSDTHYVDSNGLSSRNVASARDLSKLVAYAHNQPLLRQYSTDPRSVVEVSGKPMQFATTNGLVASPNWEIGLQKTGFINEAGRCLVMQAMIQGRSVIMVFLDSKGKLSRIADAGRMRKWLESFKTPSFGQG
ncbi:D-alanyl-D-alanine endopeptidase [Massilia sp. TS11]|uniref:D-alanyl-D-alanine endopeptidase n=1 Tax=Massilia sp. TS11 TaxID=2908003 RepID=UPI001EDBEA8A|nr:D-alanyl-D-alanine endopeptidase [Massilia sp. TS11]MCG2582769.1 D-alanyl-D-alanine endopeptidase [Massilia sp. TS11]